MEIEAAHLRTLTGRQDHIAALRGGIQALRFLPGRVEAQRISPAGGVARELAAHAFLASTGKAHHSGSVNWRMVRGAIAGSGDILRKFSGIAEAARDAWDALSSGDIPGAGRAVAREWRIRKTLASGITVPRVERAFASQAFRNGVAGAKLCGAGGGGMLFGILRDPSARKDVESLLSGLGFALFPFRPAGGPVVRREE
jgi:D-glycero-alpha-D-manno-heptose-7-phosphate kinase